MRAVTLFLLSLCFLLLKGHDNAYGGVKHIEKIQQIKFGNNDQGLPAIKNQGLSEKKDDVISVEDDEDFVSSRKYVLLPKYFAITTYSSVLLCFYHYLKNPLPFCGHLSFTSSYKYILQRVLRL